MSELGQERQQKLENIVRYGTNGEWKPVFYRPNLRIHTTRVFWITREITSYLNTVNPKIFSKALAEELAIFHDDTEILTGDTISVEKDNFTQQEKEKYEKDNLDAIDTLDKKYAELSKFGYKKLLLMDQEKESIEYFIVAYVDKLDAHMEICHEIFAGNKIFTEPLERRNIDISSYEHTRNKIVKLQKKLSGIFGVHLEDTIPLFTTSQILDFKNACKHGMPFSKNSISHKTGYTLYDSWKSLHFLYGNSREKEYLYHQKEFT